MKKLVYIVLLWIGYFYGSASFATPQLSADDFLVPLEAKNKEEQNAIINIQVPHAIKEDKGFDDQPAVVAASAQDAVNSAVTYIPEGGGCIQIKFPSGFGWVATGISTYSVYPNMTATLTAQRLAYQKAYLHAKKNLAGSLYGLSTTGRDLLASQMETIISDEDNVANLKDKSQESINECINGLLRGYVVYNVKDNQDKAHGIVTVTIVTTPKTIGRVERVNVDNISVDSIRDGLNHVLSELSNGLTPPVGGKTISVPQTGELAFIGFGSAIVGNNPNPAVRVKMSINAQKIAVMRARSALCGIILGDDIMSSSSLDETTKELSVQFEELEKEDPLIKNNTDKDGSSIKRLEEQKNSFLNNQLFREEISSFRAGVLPAGVIVKTYFNDDKTMAEAVAIYLPSATADADTARKNMQNSQIVTTQGQSKNSNKGTMPKQGPSGQVMNDADL